ncbi:MAG: hypothetical protein ABI681_03710 [Gemmatimonadales bacterium]
MRTRFTYPAVTLAVMTATTLAVVSCSSDSTAPVARTAAVDRVTASVQSQPQSFAASYDWMGKYHNDALAYAEKKIKTSKATSKDGKCKVGLAALKEFQKAFSKSRKSSAFDDLTLTDGMCEAAASGGLRVAASHLVNPARNPLAASASPGPDAYLYQIETAVDVQPSLQAFQGAVQSIQNAAASQLGALQAAAVAGTGSIATSSATYWTTGGGASLGDQPGQYSRVSEPSVRASTAVAPPNVVRYDLSPRSRRIIKADISAAIAVLIYNWWMGEAALGAAAIKAAAASLIAGLWTT